MKKFKIKVTYDAFAYIEVLAENEEQALKQMDLDMIPTSDISFRARKWNVSDEQECDDLESMVEKVTEYFRENYYNDYYQFADYVEIKYYDRYDDVCISSSIESVSFDNLYEELHFELDNEHELVLSELDSATMYNICKLLIENLSL